MTQAQNAKIAAEKSNILENLDTELAAYNIDTITGDPKDTNDMLKNLISKGVINSVLCSDNEYYDLNAHSDKTVRGIPNFDDDGKYTGYIDYSVIKDDYKIILSIDDQGIYRSEFGEVNISAGGSVGGGTTLVTENAFSSSGESGTPKEEQGKFTIEKDGASVMFVDEIGTEPLADGTIPELSIYVPAGKTANIYVFENMVLTNENVNRSAIDIEPTATLNLWIKEGKTVTVNSGFGDTGAIAEGSKAGGGMGGYAGIHVPKFESYNNVQAVSYDKATGKDIKKTNVVGSATLNLSGDGTLYAYGGEAGDGGAALSGVCGGGRRRRSWSRNRWKRRKRWKW